MCKNLIPKQDVRSNRQREAFPNCKKSIRETISREITILYKNGYRTATVALII